LSILEIKNLTKKFGGIAAVNDCSLSVKENSILGLIGPNGSGKTTMFNLITGFLQPDSGDIHFNGKRINALKPHDVARRMSASAWRCHIMRMFWNWDETDWKDPPLRLCKMKAWRKSTWGEPKACKCQTLVVGRTVCLSNTTFSMTVIQRLTYAFVDLYSRVFRSESRCMCNPKMPYDQAKYLED
jgi:energy-coupling factor transporter ATP-binding protein EcfA2